MGTTLSPPFSPVTLFHPQVDCLRYLCTGAPVPNMQGASAEQKKKMAVKRLGLDVVDHLGRAPVHRAFDFWRRDEVVS